MLHRKGKWLVFAIGGISSLAGFLYGYCTAVIAGALIQLENQFSLTTYDKEIIATSILIGALIGGLISGIFTNKLGRKITICFASLLCILFIMASVYSHNTFELSFTRGGLGFCIGIFSMAVPLYVSEISPDKYRGALVSTFQLAVTIGILLSYVSGLYFQNNGNWQWMFGVAIIPAIILSLGMMCLPESPRWLIAQQKFEKAKKILKYFYQEDFAKQKFSILMFNHHQTTVNWLTAFKYPYFSVLLVSMGIFIFQNISGIDGILFYAPKIFELGGIKTSYGMMLATISLGVVNVIATLLAMITVDSLGRRYLLLVGFFIMSLSLLLLSFFLCCLPDGNITVWATIICLCVFIFTFALSLGPIPFVLMSELFSSDIRDMSMSLSVTASWLSNIVVTFTYLSLIENLGSRGVFLLYGIICFIGLIFVFRFIPETKQLSLEQIEARIKEGRKLRDIGK